MKRYQDCNYYELLEVPRDATFQQIQTAYTLAKKTFFETNWGTYTLFSDEERENIWKKVEEAHRVLSDFDKRKSYDIFLDKGSDSPNPWDEPRDDLTSQAPVILPDLISGVFLKNIREKRRMSLQSMVSQTRISINYLTAIEEDQFRNLPPEVYLKSYLREYGKSLQLDTKKLIEGYLRHYHGHHQMKK